MADDTSTPVDSVLLDVDGTLIDSSYHHALAWARAFADAGEQPELWRVHRAIGMGGDHLVAHLLGDEFEEQHGDEARDGWQHHYEDLVGEVRAFDGAADLVRAARAQGLKVALASSSPASMTQKALAMLGLTEDAFDAVTTGDDADRAKPSPDILQVALEKAGGRSGVMVGDSTWDVEAANRLGMPTVAVLSGGFGRDELRAAGAVLVADTVADLVGTDWRALPR